MPYPGRMTRRMESMRIVVLAAAKREQAVEDTVCPGAGISGS
jgi:hypothetical protein